MKSYRQSVKCETARVFTAEGKNGNWLGVVTDARNLPKQVMQAVAKTLNFSETSFVFPSKTADYRVRFFTPEKEIPFAGHPTLGTLYVLLRNDLVAQKQKFVQEVGKRLVPLEVLPNGLIRMDQGKPVFGKTVPRELAARMLGLPDVTGLPQVVSTGLPHLIIPVRDMGDLKKARIRLSAYREMLALFGATCVMPFCISRGKVFCRMFAPALGIKEDPATGSGCGPLACYIVENGPLAVPRNGVVEMTITQGVKKPSRLFAWVHLKKGRVETVSVGGHSVLRRPRTIRL